MELEILPNLHYSINGIMILPYSGLDEIYPLESILFTYIIMA